MRNKLLPMLLVIGIALFSFGAVAAQDATPVPEGANVEILNTLEDVTANATSYYGQQVTVEGFIQELVNVRIFVLGENAALDDDKVLVINNTGQEFDLRVTRDQQVRVTGTIYPSYDEGGFDQFGVVRATEEVPAEGDGVDVMPTEEMMDDAMMATETPMDDMSDDMADMSEGMSDWSSLMLREEFNNYTILVLDSVDAITYIQVQ